MTIADAFLRFKSPAGTPSTATPPARAARDLPVGLSEVYRFGSSVDKGFSQSYLGAKKMARQLPQVTLRIFDSTDFERLISWVPTQQTLTQWCAGFFRHPLDQNQLQRYFDSASQPNTRIIFTTLDQWGDPVGHIEISMIWPHLSCRLSRILVAPNRRSEGVGNAMVAHTAAFSFETHKVDRIDLGVAANNSPAIACYQRQGFAHVGTWPKAIAVEGGFIDVYWMTLTRAAWMSSSG